ncbi:MAG: YciI family protein [Ignavibacteria bacterium]
MQKILLILTAVFIMSNISTKGYSQKAEFDSLRAAELGADDYGMKQYVLAFLKAGKVKSESHEKAQELQLEHLRNITKMAEEGVLVLAGPFMDDTEIRGIYIFDVKTIEEAQRLTETDPAIKAGILEMELHPWYGSAALMELTKLHGTIQKKSITD